jgi:hypothetical protein
VGLQSFFFFRPSLSLSQFDVIEHCLKIIDPYAFLFPLSYTEGFCFGCVSVFLCVCVFLVLLIYFSPFTETHLKLVLNICFYYTHISPSCMSLSASIHISISISMCVCVRALFLASFYLFFRRAATPLRIHPPPFFFHMYICVFLQ